MKRAFAIFLMAFAVAALGFADETAEIYQMLYKQAEGLPQKCAAVSSLVSLDDKSTAPILAAALEELLLKGQSYSSPGDQELYGRAVRLLSQALGDYKYTPAASDLWEVSQSVSDVLAQAEAIISLGKLRSLEYAERIALKLRDLNLKPTEDRDSGEKLAYACVISLDKLKDPRGFSPVFFAIDSWYSLRVRQQAIDALPRIADDPTDSIKEILGVESPERKLRALQAETASKAAPQRKVEAAVLALNLGHLKIPRDKAEGKTLADLRKLALRSLIAYKAAGPDPVDGCASSFAKGLDDEEKLLALSALGTNGSDPAASVLRDVIMKMNDDQRAGLSDDTRNRLAKAAMENAGLTKNKLLKPALLAVTFNDKWSGGILLAAQTALKAMQ
jgi:hypothetical protein